MDKVAFFGCAVYRNATKAKLRNFIRDRGKIKLPASFATKSSYSFEARGLKFDKKIY